MAHDNTRNSADSSNFTNYSRKTSQAFQRRHCSNLSKILIVFLIQVAVVVVVDGDDDVVAVVVS